MSKNISAVKKNQISLRNKYRNKSYKSAIKTLTKKYILSLDDNKSHDHMLQLSVIYKKIDKAVSKGILHKNNGSRKKSILAKAMKNFISQNV
uniref:ribosomal protein S20 n=1 Tax=Gracilaria flabelliformis subsp. simplex TaxID=1638138 RepID=UPI001D118881|nr:ribosomal protein S20 [Gracilaria flabelliformis subsp. simplex]UAD86006.1 ribosomal protein S20 [Gracilaria flabelliformis subsp. simplex]